MSGRAQVVPLDVGRALALSLVVALLVLFAIGLSVGLGFGNTYKPADAGAVGQRAPHSPQDSASGVQCRTCLSAAESRAAGRRRAASSRKTMPTSVSRGCLALAPPPPRSFGGGGGAGPQTHRRIRCAS